MKLSILFFVIFCSLMNLPLTYGQWTTMPVNSTGKFESFHFFDANNGIAATAFGGTHKTSDGGDTWTRVGGSGIRDIDFYNNNIGYAAGVVNNAVKKTTDGGNTWQSLNAVIGNSLWGVSVVSEDVAYVCGTGGEVWKTTNGSTYIGVNNPSTALMVDLFFITENKGFVLEQFNIWKTTDGGNSWTSVFNNTNHIFFTSIYFVDATIGFAVGSDGAILKTTNGGDSWTNLNTGLLDYFQYVHFYDALNGAVASTSDIYITNDGGTTWIDQNTGATEGLYSCYMFTPSLVFAGGDNGLLLKNENVTTTGIDEAVSSTESISVFPNPTTGIFTIYLPNEKCTIKLYNSAGKLIEETKTTDLSYTGDISQQKAGIYLIQIELKGKTYYSKVMKSN